MTEKENPLSKFNGNFTYEGDGKDVEFTWLGFYLQGKPDTKGWRDLFAYNEVIPVEHEGKIIPQWAIFDAHVLLQENPRAIKKALKKFGLSKKDIPPLP